MNDTIFRVIILLAIYSQSCASDPICRDGNVIYVESIYILAENTNICEPLPELPVDPQQLHGAEGRLLICPRGYIFQLKVVPEIEFYADYRQWPRDLLTGVELKADGKLLILHEAKVHTVFLSVDGFDRKHLIDLASEIPQ